MNELQRYENQNSKIKYFDESRLLLSEYTVSLVSEALRQGYITQEEENEFHLRVLNGLAYVIDDFTEGKSSSVSNDKADELMSSMMYNIDATLIALKNPGLAFATLQSKTIKYLYDKGSVALKHLMTDCTALTVTNKQNRLIGASEAYNHTLDQDIRSFMKQYNIRYGAHKNPVIPRYKTALPPRGTGIVRIKKYLTNLLAENLFCRQYDSQEISAVIKYETLRSNDMGSNMGNLYVPILICAVLCQFLVPDCNHVLLSENDVNNVVDMLEDLSTDEIKAVLTSSFSRINADNKIYHQRVFENEINSIVSAIKHNTLRTLVAYLPIPAKFD